MLSSFILLLAASPSLATPVATLDRSTVPASGRHRVHATIEAFGRYGITVQSEQGVAIQVVDKVAGPGPVFGRPGGEDGRLDAFFDRGTYRILTEGDPKSEGDAKIIVHPYRELEAPAPPALVELKPVDATLGDFEQRSYWIDVTARRRVLLEAAGRNLGDLRIWRDGSWLIEAEPTRDVTEPSVGRPLTVFRMVADFEPGLYLVTSYGGPPLAWAEDDGRHPFHLRFGIPQLPSVVRQRFQVGPLGYDRYLVSGANFFRAELAEAEPLTLEVHASAQPFGGYGGMRAEIAKNTVPPVAELDAGSGSVPWIVTVRGSEGQAYLLQAFASTWYTAIPKGGDYWVSSVHAGHAEDSIDATAIVVDAGEKYRPLVTQAVNLGSAGWARRFNLLEQATVFLDVQTAGAYRITGQGGATATYQIEPFLVTRPPEYKSPPFKSSGSDWELDRGLYVLTLEPSKKGVLEVTLAKNGFFSRQPDRAPPRPQVRFERFRFEGNAWIYLNRQPGVRVGVMARSIPIDLRDPLAVTQSPGETVEVPAQIAEEGVLSAQAEDGALLELSVDGGAWVRSARPAAGPHTVRVRIAGAHPVAYSLGLRVRRLEPDVPLPALPDARLATVPDFTELEDGKPRWFDLERTSERSFLVHARAPGLFRLESTGLLATEGNLRTRVVTSMLRAGQNGVGRNFLVQQYVGTGDYQLTVRTLGLTKGHLGLRLKRTPEDGGGSLIDGIPARATLPAGHAIVYPFRIGKHGRYRLRAIGRDRTLRCRLEDADGWPIVEPNVEAAFDRDFEAGQYRLVVLPEAVDLRVVALLERIDPPIGFEGHGPHHIALDQVVEHEWVESARSSASKPETRERDVWVFEVPAALEASIELGGKMHGDLIRVGKNGAREKVAYVPPLRGWTGKLAPGEHRLEIMNLHEGSDVPYTLVIRPVPMAVGLTRTIAAPAVLPLAIGARGLIEVSSFGPSDVEARLIDGQGRTVAKSDDRPDDWNFHIASRLDPGDYTLAINPVGGEYGSTEVEVRAREEVEREAWQLPLKTRVAVGRQVHVHPLALPDEARFLAVVAQSSETLGLVLEEESDSVFRTVATAVGRPARIELPLPAGASHRRFRVKLWSADERNLPIDVVAVAIEPVRIDERALASGETIARTRDLPIAVAEVVLDRPGTFAMQGSLRWASSEREAARTPVRGLLHPEGTRVWLVKDVGRRGKARFAGRRVVLENGTLDFVLGERPTVVDLAGEGPALVRVEVPKTQPAVCATGTSERIGPECFDVASHGAISVRLEDGPGVARIWPARSGVPGPFDAALEVRHFGAPESSEVPEGTLSPGRARAFELPAGPKRLALSLEEGTVAVLSEGTRLERVAWANGATEIFEGSGRTLTLLNPSADKTTFAFEVLPLEERAAARGLTQPFERTAVRAGREQVLVPAGKQDRRLYVRGGDAVLIGTDGTVDTPDGEGAFLLGSGGGALRIDHGVGLVMAWIDPPGASGAGLFDAMPPAARDVSIPSVVSLSGSTTALRFTTDRPRLVHVRTEAPAAGRWIAGGADSGPVIRARGGTYDLYLPSGRGTLVLRSIGGGALYGSAEVTASPVDPLREGLGPEVMIAPGAGRAFAFQMKAKGPIGIGVRSDAADVEAVLRDARGRSIGTGVVQMHELERGTYVLEVFTPPGGRPARARPALVGLDRPPSGPPAQVVESYLRTAGYRER